MTTRMRMTGISTKILKFLLVADAVLAAVSVIFFDIRVFYSMQIGFITSMSVMLASFISYRRMITVRAEKEIVMIDDSKDAIDRVEDPYDLYDNEETTKSEEQSLAETIKEEKKKLKENRRSLFEILKDTKAALSVYRLGAYLLLVLGFLYLQRHELLHIPGYLFTLCLPPVIIVAILLRDKSNDSTDTIQ